MFSIINRDRMPVAVADEFEHLVTRLKAIWLTEHTEQGRHLIRPRGFDFVPIGAVMAWTTDTAPDGWVLCRGQQLSRVDYKALFDVIGTTYGAGDGSTTFHVPDLQQRFPLGKAPAGTGATLASTGGSIDHTHTVPAHTHGVSIGTSSDGSHTHPFSGTTGFAIDGSVPPAFHYANGADGSHAHNFSGTTDASGTHSHTASGSTDNSGAGTSGTANPPFLALNYIILAGVA